MRIVRIGAAAVLALGVGGGVVAGGACGPGSAHVGLLLRAPEGVDDDVNKVTLRVVDKGSAKCAADGSVSGKPDEEFDETFDLDKTGCAAGAKYCATVEIPQDEVTKLFIVQGKAGGELRFQGCAKATPDADELAVKITLHRYVAPSCCNDGVVQPKEQCDSGKKAPDFCGQPGGGDCQGIVVPDDVCECDCKAKEILLSIPGMTPPMDNAVGTKKELALAFSGKNGALGGALRAVFVDSSPASSASIGDVNVRYLQKTLAPFPGELAPQLRLPQCDAMGKITLTGRTAREQKSPAIARVSDDIVAVVYASDHTTGNLQGDFDIYLSAQGKDGCANQAFFQLKVNDEAGGASASNPAIAGGPPGKALVVWAEGTNLRGKVFNAGTGSFEPSGANVNLGVIGAGRPRVTGSAAGWLLVFAGVCDKEDSDAVCLLPVNEAGVPGVPKRVNNATGGVQSEPDVARLDDGSAAVTWVSDGRIYMQRFNAQLEPHAGDQDAPVTKSSKTPASQPAIAAGKLASGTGFYAMAWRSADEDIWARYADATSGFRLNNVDGQLGDFRASHPAIGKPRASPVITVTPADGTPDDDYVVIGWLDTSADHFGLYVRRFPLPR
jgi:hypothetical protein